MKRFSFFVSCVFSLALCVVFSHNTLAQQNNISPTVQIVSYLQTKNGELVPQATGSATIISKEGLIITNNHVIEKTETSTFDAFGICFSFDVHEKVKCTATASFIARDRNMDVALLKINTEDIYGKSFSSLPFLSTDRIPTLKNQEKIQVYGFPDIGGETITVTQGQISGFETYNNLSYIKTDAAISFGNSGGTAVNEQGQFIGIPTFIVSSGSTLGYVLDIKAAVSFIQNNKNKNPEWNKALYEKLNKDLKTKDEAFKTGKYIHDEGIKFSWNLPTTWEFSSLDSNSVVAVSKNKTDAQEIRIHFDDFPFLLTDSYVQQKFIDPLDKDQKNVSQYTKEQIEWKGYKTTKITYILWNQRVIRYIVPIQNTLFEIIYEISLSNTDTSIQEKTYEDMLALLSFDPNLPIFSQKTDLNTDIFQLQSPKDWYISQNPASLGEYGIAIFLRPDDPYAQISMLEAERLESEKALSNEELLDNLLKEFEHDENLWLLNKNDKVMVAGMPGISVTYRYTDPNDPEKMRKTSRLYLLNNDSYYIFEYEAQEKEYGTYLEDFVTLLSSFQLKKGSHSTEFEIGILDAVFSDIAFHRYEQAIISLYKTGMELNIQDGAFRPEQTLSRLEALNFLLQNRLVFEKEQGKDTLAQSLAELESNMDILNLKFEDIKELSIQDQVAIEYAYSKNIIRGKNTTQFSPNDDCSIAEFMAMMLRMYDIRVWTPPVEISFLIPWYKPLMDKGFELQIIPYGIYKADHMVTRGEAAFMIVQFDEQFHSNY